MIQYLLMFMTVFNKLDSKFNQLGARPPIFIFISKTARGWYCS